MTRRISKKELFELEGVRGAYLRLQAAARLLNMAVAFAIGTSLAPHDPCSIYPQVPFLCMSIVMLLAALLVNEWPHNLEYYERRIRSYKLITFKGEQRLTIELDDEVVNFEFDSVWPSELFTILQCCLGVKKASEQQVGISCQINYELLIRTDEGVVSVRGKMHLDLTNLTLDEVLDETHLSLVKSDIYPSIALSASLYGDLFQWTFMLPGEFTSRCRRLKAYLQTVHTM